MPFAPAGAGRSNLWMEASIRRLHDLVAAERGEFLDLAVMGRRERASGRHPGADIPPFLFLTETTGRSPEARASNGASGCRIADELAITLGMRPWTEYARKLPPKRRTALNVGISAPPSGPGIGRHFERAIERFLERTFNGIVAPVLRPGDYTISSGGGCTARVLPDFEQYSYLAAPHAEAEAILSTLEGRVGGKVMAEVRSALGRMTRAQDDTYEVAPDILVYRNPKEGRPLTRRTSTGAPWDPRNPFAPRRGAHPYLVAVVSAKLTLRSDRGQSSRSEGSYLAQHRRGAMCRLALVTAEPKPSRLLSVAGGAEIDHVYHVALRELHDAVHATLGAGSEEYASLVHMVEAGRLKDIADLPFDLAA